MSEILSAARETNRNIDLYSPIRKTGMKAPQGTGMVVATADIQNWDGQRRKLVWEILKLSSPDSSMCQTAYLHDDEEDERDEDVDLRVFPGVVVADVVELFGHALTAPRAVVEQRHQRLVLRQLTTSGKTLIWMFACYILTR